MRFLKNRTVVGVICILLSLLLCFVIAPLFSKSSGQAVQIVRVVSEIKDGEQITESMVKTVKVGGYNLPAGVIKDADEVTGKYAARDMSAGDYIFPAKITDVPAADSGQLGSLDGKRQAMSVTIRSLAAGLSGKLQNGDIISVIAPDYRKQGISVIPPELKYIKVIGVTAPSGYEANTGSAYTEDERELPSTLTLLVTPVQSRILAELEAEGKMHFSLVYRGEEQNAAKFIAAQDEVLAGGGEETNGGEGADADWPY